MSGHLDISDCVLETPWDIPAYVCNYMVIGTNCYLFVFCWFVCVFDDLFPGFCHGGKEKPLLPSLNW